MTFDSVELRWDAAYGRDYEVSGYLNLLTQTYRSYPLSNCIALILFLPTLLCLKIQVSNSTDLSSWETVETITNGDGGDDDINFPQETARYVRMYGTRRGSMRFGYSLYEFEVYNSGGSPPTTGTPPGPGGCPGDTDPLLHYTESTLDTPNRTADLLCRMTLDEKIGQMTQIEKNSLTSDNDISTYLLGSLLSGGGGAPDAGNFPADWADMYDRFQAEALSTSLKIPLIFGVDSVHGHSNVYGATIFPHNIGLGAARNPSLMKEIGEITAIETRATGIPWVFGKYICLLMFSLSHLHSTLYIYYFISTMPLRYKGREVGTNL